MNINVDELDIWLMDCPDYSQEDRELIINAIMEFRALTKPE